jgi:hypothetical protein
MEILGKLFGTPAKVKIIRLFLSNPGVGFEVQDVSKRTKTNSSGTRKELSNLDKIGLIKRKSFSKEVERKRGRKVSLEKKRVSGWILDESFPYLEPLKNLLIRLSPMKHRDILKKLEKVGKLKVVIVSGIFIQEFESRVDILIVGDKIKDSAVDSVIKDIEAEVGKEVRYSVFDTKDFHYRLGMYDKLIRDILDYPHEKVIDKLGINY